MAMVLDAFASYLQSMLTEMATEEVHMLLGVSTEIENMTDKLKDLKNFLADADRRNITDKHVQEWVGQLKRAMYEAADILDLCQLKAMEQGESTVDVGCFNPLLFCMRNPIHAHDIGTRLKALNKRLDSIKDRSTAFSFINLSSYDDRSSTAHVSPSGNRETSGEFDRSGVVGEKIVEDTRALVEIMLTEKEGSTNIMVVAVVGIGGIGKTTLAQKVFDDETMNARFDKKIWLSINQDFNKVELLRTIIMLAGGEHGGEKALAVLQPVLTAALTGKKLLLVLDDVWSHGAWCDVLQIPLANVVARGSRVLVTTRDERVARGMKAVLPYHRVDKLEEEDAWSLLKKQIVSNNETDEHQIDILKDIGLQILERCDGLPLAVKVMGGLLCQKEKKHREWEMVLNDSIWSVSEMPKELNHAVYLSYEDLPSCIKQCFLYYSVLGKTTSYHCSSIIGMWISEGFVHGTSEDLEELGHKYYKELILRNLIEPDRYHIDQQLCNMHDVVRSFAQFVARDEVLSAQSGETNIVSKFSTHKFLRISLESKTSELDWSSLQAQKAARTLVSVGQINMKPGVSLSNFPCLRTLYISNAHVSALVESLHELKHLRYLSLEKTDISSLPDGIGKMKFLQYISLGGCQQFVKLPCSILKLGQIRNLNFNHTIVNNIPRGFCVLTNLRRLLGFPALVDGDWCSLEELGFLSRLTTLGLTGLENVTASSSAVKAKLYEKVYLTDLVLCYGTRFDDDGPVEEEYNVSEEDQQRMEKILDVLCPPPSIEVLSICNWFGRRLPRWMMSSSDVPLKSLRTLMIIRLACCTQLPDGLCQLPNLEIFQIDRAPAIKRIGPEFLHSHHHHSPLPSQAVPVFPRLTKMNFSGMVEWEEWEWEEQVQAFPVLQELLLMHCKLKCLPPGLASQARALEQLSIQCVQGLMSLQHFASLVKLELLEVNDLERITNLPRLQKLTIIRCPKLKVLEGVPALHMLVLLDDSMEKLPEYMVSINLRYLRLRCSLALLASIAAGQSGPEWAKFSHVGYVKAYHNEKKGYVSYTANPYNLETNVNRSFMSTGTLSFFEDAQIFESVLKMTRKNFSYICSLVAEPSLEDMSRYTFVDGRVLCLEDRVAVALRRLHSSEPTETLGSSVGVTESTVLLVTERFVHTVYKQANQRLCWPYCSEMDEIKSMFDKNHNMHNCCGVIFTTHLPFGPNYDRAKNDGYLMQFVVDPKMRFMNIMLDFTNGNTQSSIFQNSGLLKDLETGIHLNGRKLKVALGAEVGEYIIGDAGYPLLPWLLTPYQEENLSDSKAEFNMRHSAATTCALKALARLKDTWKYLQEDVWWPVDPDTRDKMIGACLILHNIGIYMEDGAELPNLKEPDYCQEVRQLENEDAVRARDMLSQYFLTSRSSESGGTISCLGDSHMFEAVFKMTRKAFNYICGLVKVSLLDDTNSYTFVDRRWLSLEDRVAVSLRRLYSNEPLETIGSPVGVNESTVLLVTEWFVNAMYKQANRQLYWPDSNKIDQIKSMFGKIHNMHNCCGVICKTHIPFQPNCDHNSLEVQVVVDPEMRFSDIWLRWVGSKNPLSILQRSEIFEECEKGIRLNGSNLKVALDGSVVGEYIIGDGGYPLLPWLLTPYQEEDLSGSMAEFNRRHSAATTCALKALARFKDTWKYLQGETSCPVDPNTLDNIIYACCMLHNVMIDMENDAAMPSAYAEDWNYHQQVRQIANEDAVRARDMLSQYFLTTKSSESGVSVDAEEDHEVVSSGSGYEGKEEELQTITAEEESEC